MTEATLKKIKWNKNDGVSEWVRGVGESISSATSQKWGHLHFDGKILISESQATSQLTSGCLTKAQRSPMPPISVTASFWGSFRCCVSKVITHWKLLSSICDSHQRWKDVIAQVAGHSATETFEIDSQSSCPSELGSCWICFAGGGSSIYIF